MHPAFSSYCARTWLAALEAVAAAAATTAAEPTARAVGRTAIGAVAIRVDGTAATTTTATTPAVVVAAAVGPLEEAAAAGVLWREVWEGSCAASRGMRVLFNRLTVQLAGGGCDVQPGTAADRSCYRVMARQAQACMSSKPAALICLGLHATTRMHQRKRITGQPIHPYKHLPLPRTSRCF